jgi:hypothetical protein
VVTRGKVGAAVETTSTIEPELSGYCRSKVPYPEQIRRWKKAGLQDSCSAGKQRQQRQREAKRDKQRIKTLERDLRRKEKDLAKTAALLLLLEKLDVLFEDTRPSDIVPKAAQLLGWVDEAVDASARKLGNPPENQQCSEVEFSRNVTTGDST